MLTEQRHEIILKLLEENKSVMVTELKEILETSESTIRRDITALDRQGKLTKVFGGAVARKHVVTADEPTVAQKADLNIAQKQKIAGFAALKVLPEDFVYLDAGTTTGCMLQQLKGTKAAFVTNAVAHARTLALMGVKVSLVGGELKGSTEAVVGSQSMRMLKNFHFTKGFFGTNGITVKEGFTTPDGNEAMTKRTAMEQCRSCYVLADASKFGHVSPVTFGDFSGAEILTDVCPKEYKKYKNIIVVD